MTPGTLTTFQKGDSYKMSVLFASQNEPWYINTQMEDGRCYKVEVPGLTKQQVQKLKDKKVELVCTEVTDKGPEFSLAPRYFAPAPAPVPRRPMRGANIGLSENVKVEFKKSLVFSPQTQQPDSDQPFEIAKEIAAFMNTSGGDLYLGVNDNGFVTGIENDLPHLGEAPIMMDRVLDGKYEYKANPDGFTTKLTTAIRCYLGEASAALVGPVEVLTDSPSGLQYVKVHVEPSTEVVYLGRDESVVFRAQTSVLYLKGRQRELYVKGRFYDTNDATSERIEKLLATIDDQAKKIDAMQENLRVAVENGKIAPNVDAAPVSIPDDSSIPLDKAYLDAIRSPGGLVFNGSFCGEAKSWGDLFLRLLEKLAAVDPAKFKALPDESVLRLKGGRVVFARKGNRIHFDKASPYLGPDGDVRVDLAVGTKAGFTQETGVPFRLIRHFNLKPEQFRIWTGKQG